MPAYIQMPDIKGESKEQNHDGWIYVDAVSMPIARSISEGATGVQRSNGTTMLADIVVSKTWDSSSPKMMLACAQGTFMDEVVIHLCSMINKKNVTNLEIKLSDVIVTSYNFHGTSDQAPTPSEDITLNYTKIEWNYKKYKEDGSEDGNFPATYDSQADAN